MNTNSKRIIRWIGIRLLIASFGLLGFIFYGLHLMDIEDRYGDLQELYWRSRDGDIIVNNFNSKIGIIKFERHRIYVKKDATLIDADEWLDQERKNKYSLAIYRPINELEKIDNMNISEVTSQCKLITKLNVDY